MISIIVAISSSGVIAANGKIPWKCPADMKYFKDTTTNNIVIMGRKTWDSIGRNCLPNRGNIVVTRNPNNIRCASSLRRGIPRFALSIEAAIRIASMSYLYEQPEIFIIGGEEIYRQCLQKNIVDKVYLSLIDDKLCKRCKPIGLKRFDIDMLSEWKKVKTENKKGFKLLILEKAENDAQ